MHSFLRFYALVSLWLKEPHTRLDTRLHNMQHTVQAPVKFPLLPSINDTTARFA